MWNTHPSLDTFIFSYMINYFCGMYMLNSITLLDIFEKTLIEYKVITWKQITLRQRKDSV